MRSPPGWAILNSLKRAAKAPINKTDMRDLPTSDGSILFGSRSGPALIFNSFLPIQEISAPIPFRTSTSRKTSSTSGMLDKRHSSCVNKAAAIAGPAAFL